MSYRRGSTAKTSSAGDHLAVFKPPRRSRTRVSHVTFCVVKKKKYVFFFEISFFFFFLLFAGIACLRAGFIVPRDYFYCPPSGGERTTPPRAYTGRGRGGRNEIHSLVRTWDSSAATTVVFTTRVSHGRNDMAGVRACVCVRVRVHAYVTTLVCCYYCSNYASCTTY